MRLSVGADPPQTSAASASKVPGRNSLMSWIVPNRLCFGRASRRERQATTIGSEMGDDTKTKDKTAGKGLYPVLPLRDIVVFPIHDRPAVRRARQVDQRAGRGDAFGQAHPACRAEERRRRRSSHRRDLSRRHPGVRSAAAEASRRHREGAGRGHNACEDPALHRQPELLRGRGRDGAREHRRQGRDRGARPLGGGAVRELREAQQEDLP